MSSFLQPPDPDPCPCEEYGDHSLVLKTGLGGEPYWQCTTCGYCEQDDGPAEPPGGIV